MLPISDIFEEMYEAESKLKETIEDADSLILIEEITRGTTELEQLMTATLQKNLQGDKK